MKKIILLCLLIIAQTVAQKIELTVTGSQQAKMPLALFVLNESEQLSDIARTIQKNLEFTDQFSVTIHNTSIKELLKDMKLLCAQGTPLAACINSNSEKIIEWRLYETAQMTMIEGKKYKKKGTVVRGWAHAVADELWTTLTGQKGFFSSRITYCKEHHTKKNVSLKKIYIADFDGSNEELLVDGNSIIVTPRWHVDTTNPLLFFSEYTKKNVRLVASTMKKQYKITSNFDGINMMPAFSPDGKTAIYSASHGSGHCQLYLYHNETLKQCTNNKGTNVSANFIDEDHICFCSDAPTGSPQVYILELSTNTLTPVTKSGYCTSPTYCKTTNSIFYHRMINHVMQICHYDCMTKRHTQLTKGGGNKHEVCCSPCGTQLLFAHEYASKKSRLENLNLITNRIMRISTHNDHCGYPHWSPCYAIFPTIT